ncbi:MAG: M20/M25/M40 family metallo-hydrolase [Acidimicrobiales bacterium]|jgi:acetylornithine deacetylase/succinyl-diaminopimelate desuccinylase-like protein
MAFSSDVRDPEVVDLLQHLIRNACVNDGTEASGHERANADILRAGLEGSGCDLETYEPLPGRTSLVARIDGREADAPALCYLGHTDVVPVNPDTWSRDPFGGELVDGEVWGRGAVDMLNLTASMAVAFGRLARSGFRPRGTLILAAVADEEALGSHGTGWLTEHAASSVEADYVITEEGGVPIETPGGRRLAITVGEKGSCWCRLRVRGTAGHASAPLRTDNALVTAAAIVGRLAAFRPMPDVHDAWRRFVGGMALPEEIAAMFLDPARIDEICESFPHLGLARQAHACTHMTIAPTIVHGGTKLNVIPDQVELDLDVRTLPGQTEDDVRSLLAEAIGDLGDKVEIVWAHNDPASESPVGTPLWDELDAMVKRFHPGAESVPYFSTGATDGRFFRRRGAVAYGFGMFSDRLSFDQFLSMFHGDDERVDIESLALSTEMFEALPRSFLA